MTRLLLVEDDPDLGDLFAGFLREQEVFRAASVEEALAHISGADLFDAAVIDFWLGEGTAIPILDELRDQCPDVPVILVSGGTESFSPEMTEAVGAISGHDVFLQKPFRRSNLLKALKSVLEAR